MASTPADATGVVVVASSPGTDAKAQSGGRRSLEYHSAPAIAASARIINSGGRRCSCRSTYESASAASAIVAVSASLIDVRANRTTALRMIATSAALIAPSTGATWGV